MTAREWKAGDVALVDGHVALVWSDPLAATPLSFVYTDDDGDACSVYVTSHPDARLLVTLDLKQTVGKGLLPQWLRYQAEQIARRSAGGVASVSKDMRYIADQIDGIIRPPISEPKGRYAVVVDRAGEEWIRDGLERDGWWAGTWWNVDRHLQASPDTWRADWADVDAVEVLFAGLPPRADQ